MRPIWLFLAALVLAQSAAAVTDSDRTQVYREFRELFDAHQYEEARPLAQKLVALTEEQYGTADRALVNPLSNLATTAYRLKDYEAAQQSYTRGIEILDATAGAANRQLFRPLQGLGATYMAMGQYENAIVPLKRAVDLSRNLDGLFNVEQLQYLNPLIESYAALENTPEVDKQQQYALRVAENAYGKSDPRMLEPLDRYARWLESVDRYSSARVLHQRALVIALQSGGRDSIRTVIPLQGMARTYRLELLNGAETPSEGEESFGGGSAFRSELGSGPRLNPDAERALKQALLIIDKAQPVDRKLRGETLIELGDLYLSLGVPKAMGTYQEAWKELAQADATKPLEAPRLIAYKGPSSSLKRSTLDAESAELHYVEVRFTVTKDGRTANVTTASSDASETQQKAVMTSIKKARYSPRFENGEPVETQGVTYRERLLTKKAKN